MLFWRARLALALAPLPNRWVLVGVLGVAVAAIGVPLWCAWPDGRPAPALRSLADSRCLLRLYAHRPVVVVAYLGLFALATACGDDKTATPTTAPLTTTATASASANPSTTTTTPAGSSTAVPIPSTFPTVVDVSGDLRGRLKAKFPHIFPPM